MEFISTHIHNPFLWATIISVTINILLYLLNKRTFKILYEKPRFQIRNISVKPDSADRLGFIVAGALIGLRIFNPSSFPNLIISYSLRTFPFFTLIYQDQIDINLAQFDYSYYDLPFNYEKTQKYKNRKVILTLVDIKKRKTWKTFKLFNKNLIRPDTR